MDAALTYRIDTAPGGATGSHWDSMIPVAEHLDQALGVLDAAVQLAHGRGMAPAIADDYGVDPEDDDLDIHEFMELVALEVRVARWESEGRPLARAVIVLGTGGPHVELDIEFGTFGGPERVTLSRYWSGAQHAYTTDPRALDMLVDFAASYLEVV